MVAVDNYHHFRDSLLTQNFFLFEYVYLKDQINPAHMTVLLECKLVRKLKINFKIRVYTVYIRVAFKSFNWRRGKTRGQNLIRRGKNRQKKEERQYEMVGKV